MSPSSFALSAKNFHQYCVNISVNGQHALITLNVCILLTMVMVNNMCVTLIDYDGENDPGDTE